MDTGAARTVISEKTFNRLSENRKPLLKKSTELCNCSGKPLREIGKANFDIEIVSFTFKREIIVAGIADEGLLGMDILMEGGKPANVLLSRVVILFRGEEIPCKTRISRSIRRVVPADNEVIPPYSEKLIDVFIQRFEDDEASFEENVLVSPTPSFQRIILCTWLNVYLMSKTK